MPIINPVFFKPTPMETIQITVFDKRSTTSSNSKIYIDGNSISSQTLVKNQTYSYSVSAGTSHIISATNYGLEDVYITDGNGNLLTPQYQDNVSYTFNPSNINVFKVYFNMNPV